MRYLYRPSASEELSVRGRYQWVAADGSAWASEAWERYRQQGSPVEAWRAERTATDETWLAHSVVSPEGLERAKLRLIRPGAMSQNVTLTLEPDAVQLREGDTWREVALPPGYGVVLPLVSLARFAFPFDLAHDARELAMTLLGRARREGLHLRPAKLGYTPLGLREFEVRGTRLLGKGWRAEAPGLPAQEAWFDHNGTCLFWRTEGQGEARLVEWLRFG